MSITVASGITIGTGITVNGPITPPVLPAGVVYTDVTYGNGAYVAVAVVDGPSTASAGAISYDGLTWTAVTMPSADYSAVTWGNNRYVAIGFGTSAAYSLDGVTWTASTLPRSQGWESVAYGGGVFVAVGETTLGGSTIYYATSTDGITWTERTFNNGDWRDIVYGNSEFVAINSNGSSQVSSSGTASWTSSGSLGNDYTSVAYGNGRYVAVTQNSGINEASWSTDGLTWTPDRGIITTARWDNVAFGSGLFVATPFATDISGAPSDQTMYSSDGVTWFPGTLPQPAIWSGIAYSPDLYQRFVAVGYNFTGSEYVAVAAVSRDGITWY
jgi:hypothetical protein